MKISRFFVAAFTFFLLFVDLLAPRIAHAQETPASGKWGEVEYFAYQGAARVFGKDPIEVCKLAYETGPTDTWYKGYRFIKLHRADPEATPYGSCESQCTNCQSNPQTPVYDICMTYEVVNGVKTQATWKYGAENCAKPCPLCSFKVGNPVEVSDFAKVTTAIDWVSPIDSRFKIERNYRSDAGFLTRFGGEQFSKRHEFGKIWQRTYNETRVSATNPFDPADTRAWTAFEDSRGSRLYFQLKFYSTRGPDVLETIGGERYQVGESARMGTSYSGLALVDPAGVKRFYDRYGILEQTVWPDGYKITNDIEPSVNRDYVAGMTDNKGNRVSFVFNQNVVPGADRQSISEIIIYRLSGGTYVETGRLLYGYSTPEFPAVGLDGNAVSGLPGSTDPKMPMLISVDYLAAGSTTPTAVWRYTYATALPPGALLPDLTRESAQRGSVVMPLLTSISDGGAVPYAEYTYKYYGYEVAGPAGSSTKDRYLGFGVSTEKYAGDPQSTVFGKPGGGSTHTMTNPLGLTTSFTFTDTKWNKKVTGISTVAAPGASATSRSFTFATGNIDAAVETVNRNAAKTTYTRDTKGRILTATEDSTGTPRTTTYTWHATLSLPLTRVTDGLTESFTYDTNGLLLTYTQTDTKAGSPTLNQTRTWTYGYTTLANGLKVLTTLNGPGLPAEGINDVTTYTYTATGDLATATDPMGLVTTVLARNANGQPTLVEQPDLSRWSFTYDYEGRVLTAGFAGPGQTALLSTFTYNQTGQVLTYTNTRGKIWTFTYNNARRLTETTGPTGDKVTYTYDAAGNVIKEEYRNGTNPVTFWEGTDFDGLSRVLRTIGAMGQTWTYANDVEDNLTGITDPINKTTTHAYDKLNRLISTIDRDNFTTGMTYNAQDQLTEYTDPRTIKTTFTRNGFGEVVSEVSADRGTTTYTYDRRGLVKTRTDGRNITVTYAYDNAGRLTLIDYPTGTIPDIAFTYDAPFQGVPANSNKGHVGRITDGIIATEFGHDVTATGPRIKATATYPAGRVYSVTEETDFEGNPTRTIYPSGKEVLYTVDDANRITSIRLNNGGTTTDLLTAMTYMPMGGLKTALYGDGYTQTRTYDLSYRLTGIKDALGATKLRDIAMGYEGRDNLNAITDLMVAGNSETFTYTPRESLASATGIYGGVSYTYDAVGNRLTSTLGTATDTYTYPATSNRLSSIALASGGTRGFTYDAAGNVTAEARPGGTYGYTYNAAGRMSEFRINGVLQASYRYDAMGRQAIRTLSSPTAVTIHSVFDSEGRRIAEYNETSGALIREYVWNGWDPVAVIEGGVISFVRADHIGRPVFATNAAGVKVWSATYQPFGGVHVSTGTLPSNRFPGQWFQSESGLHQNWMRDYDPTTGRYLQPDPLGLIDGASVYGYAAQSPMMLTDPTGEFIPAWAAGAAAGAAIALLFELMENDWRWECVDWWNVGAGAAFGAVGGQAASFWAHGATGYSRYGYSKALRSYRSAFGIRGGGTEVHHVFAVNGAKGAGWRNSAWWLKPLPKSTHRRLHGSWGLLPKYGPARQAWHGSPGWAKGVLFPPAAGAVADWANPCVCEN